MKAVILAGGFGTRLSEETSVKPKPMVEIGGRPILWHIMSHYARHNVKDFIICLGYKSEYIKKFFLDYSATLSDFTVDLGSSNINIHHKRAEDWKVTLIDTGLHTMTGGRIKRALEHVNQDEPFCMTYGDGLSNVNITESIKFHKENKKLCTVTAVTPPGRFGVLDVADNKEVVGFREKIASDQYRINGGFFVLDPQIGNYINNDTTVWEDEPLTSLAQDGQVMAFEHDGFWQPMDTLRDKTQLEKLWQSGNPPWRI
jgi:glucose-1-phosphate cytidylyltransferase